MTGPVLPRFSRTATTNPAYQHRVAYAAARQRKRNWRLWSQLAFNLGFGLVLVAVAIRIGTLACR